MVLKYFALLLVVCVAQQCLANPVDNIEVTEQPGLLLGNYGFFDVIIKILQNCRFALAMVASEFVAIIGQLYSIYWEISQGFKRYYECNQLSEDTLISECKQKIRSESFQKVLTHLKFIDLHLKDAVLETVNLPYCLLPTN